MKDWTNNALIPLGLHQESNRYKNSEKIQKKANEKYGKSNVIKPSISLELFNVICFMKFSSLLYKIVLN